MTVVLTLVSVSFIFVVSGAAANFLKRKFIGYCKVGYCRIFLKRTQFMFKTEIVIGDIVFQALEGALCKPNTRKSTKLYCLLRSKFCINLSWRFRNLSSHFLNNTVYTRLKLIQFQFCVYAIKIGNCKIWRFVRCCLPRKKEFISTVGK